MNKNIDIKNIKVAKRYALALSKSAAECIDDVFSDLSAIEETIFRNDELKTFFSHPVVSLKDKKEALNAAFENKINRISLNFIQTLLDESRFEIFKTIFELFKKEVDLIKNTQQAEIISAVTLTDDTKKRLEEKLSAKLNKNVILNCSVDEKILGGLVVKIEDKVIDLSLKTKFETLKNI